MVPLTAAAQQGIPLKLNVPIPGFSALCATEGQLLVDETTFGCYVSNFYVWFTGVAGILAVVMIMWAGVQWITAAGNESRITTAKTTMNGAAIGIIILLSSYLLLTWINPALIKLDIPALKSVDKILIGSRFCEDQTSALLWVVEIDIFFGP